MKALTKGDWQKIRNALYGLRIGDAMGRFQEIMTHTEILERTKGKGVNGFHFFERPDAPWWHEGMSEEDLGGVTDDTILSDAFLDSLIACGGFNLTDVALRQICAYENDPSKGFGGSTRKGLMEIKKYFQTCASEGRRPGVWRKKEEGTGLGNGVAIKIAPLAFWNIAKTCVSYGANMGFSSVYQIGSLTHSDERASCAAATLLFILQRIFKEPLQNDDDVTDLIEEMLEKLSPKKNTGLKDSGFYESLEAFLSNESMLELKFLRDEIGNGCIVTESVLFSIGIFFRNYDNFENGVLEAINAGGDTDSTASMVGTLIGMNSTHGDCIPKSWREYRPEYKSVVEYYIRELKTYNQKGERF